MDNQKQRDKIIFELGYKYLLSFDSTTEAQIENHLMKSIYDRPADLKIIYKRVVESAQNRSMMPNVIGGSIDGVENLGKVLFDFDARQVETYYGNDVDRFLDEVKEKLKPRGKFRRTTRSSWPIFGRSVLSGANFMSQFESSDDFYQWCDFFDSDERSRLALPLLIGDRISGFGFPLACDFLKELGYRNFGKPDVHIIGIFGRLKLSNSDKDTRVFEAIQRVADAVGRDAFAVDKLFWLIGSDWLKVGSSREDFIQFTQKHLST